MGRGRDKRRGRFFCLQVILLAGMITSFGKLCQIFMQYEKPRLEYKKIADMTNKEEYHQTAYRKKTDDLTEINSDYAAWITIPGTVVNYPVVHGTDNEYYLTHSFTKREDECGCIFLDAENQSVNDPDIVLYGHNRKDGSMFAVLKRYLDKEFFDANSAIYLEIGGYLYLYHITSCYVAEEDGSKLPGEWNEREREEDLVPAGNRRRLTLSTCYGADKRVIVQAIRMCYTES